ncbi:hypothetical protein VOLCADRAFT_118581 [Volvox carteri f. nagariensis]|uniref:RRM domain-containing protein n=1 Tax=Volvox carteri f. nagariensis TaxID=3068 RepID=D8U5W8_VOLCA|nr:uncharacterized protein VOLCADRAFT_118581 [Volvox carteri f. nagariensis]EFJ44830.1 hypothetical protein VOLCADRAFT_118581 [Volvox carteri f. nagariensis]|eukprot:XP_002954113.1 hypothetical protein VOLCADRAFT_118581 [Volvox carteri f. nagariensis]
MTPFRNWRSPVCLWCLGADFCSMQASFHAALRDSYVLEDNRQLFFAKVLRSATEDEVRRLFGQFGKVTDVNLFRAFQGAPTTKGCGLVTMGSHDEAVSAIAALDSQYVWEGMETPMVVKWMDTALQRRRREQHLANMRQAMAPGGAGLGCVPGGLSLATSIPSAGSLGGLAGLQNTFLDALEPTEMPPPGCSPDAIKLFVGNVPKCCTEEQLLPLFQSIGKVVELVIVHDKVTRESKGSAFVWYATRPDAERAILQFNFRHVLPDPSGDQDRPLVVRRAKTRAKPLKHAVPLLQPFYKLTTQPAAGSHSHHEHHTHHHLVGLSGLEALQLTTDANSLAAQLAAATAAGSPQDQQASACGGLAGGLGGIGVGMGNMPTYRPLASLAGQFGLQTTSSTMYDAFGAGDTILGDFSMTQTLQQNAAAAAAAVQQLDVLGAAQQAAAAVAATQQHHHHHHQQQQHQQQQQQQHHQHQHIAQSMTLNQTQLTLLNAHLFSVQTVSGAQLHISPGAPGLFNLVVTGSEVQVEAAKGLITTVLSHT